jgi:hypothetical protein
MLFTTPCGARNSRISLDNLSYIFPQLHPVWSGFYVLCFVRIQLTPLGFQCRRMKEFSEYPVPFERLHWLSDALTTSLELAIV